jgi:hypothetical protein
MLYQIPQAVTRIANCPAGFFENLVDLFSPLVGLRAHFLEPPISLFLPPVGFPHTFLEHSPELFKSYPLGQLRPQKRCQASNH